MAHDPAHLGQVGTLGEHHIAHRHPGRAEQARDIGGIAVRLFRAVIDEDLVVRRAGALRQLHDGIPHRPVRGRGVVVEQRLDQDRRDDQHEDHGQGRQPRAPGPPQPPRMPDDEIQADDQQAGEHRRDRRTHQGLGQPSGQRLTGQAVLCLAPPAFVDRPRQGQHETEQQIDHANDQRDQLRPPAPPLQPVADTAEKAGSYDEPAHDDGDDRPPQQQPVAAARIGHGPFQILGRKGRQPARGLGRRVDAHDGVLPDARR